MNNALYPESATHYPTLPSVRLIRHGHWHPHPARFSLTVANECVRKHSGVGTRRLQKWTMTCWTICLCTRGAPMSMGWYRHKNSTYLIMLQKGIRCKGFCSEARGILRSDFMWQICAEIFTTLKSPISAESKLLYMYSSTSQHLPFM